MKKVVLIAWPIPARDAREGTWKKWRQAFEVAWGRNAGRAQFGTGGIGVCAKVVQSSAHRKTGLPAYICSPVQMALLAVGAIQSTTQIKCFTIEAAEPKAPLRAGNVVLTVEDLR